MAYLIRDGVAVYYEVYGQGPTVLLTHGFAATGRMWSDQIDLLARGRQLVLWDMRGHGRTDSPADHSRYSESATVADMAGILDAVGADRAIIGGHSLGGYMSLAFHRLHRQKVTALLLCGTGPGYRKDDARDQWNAVARKMGDDIEREGLNYITKFSVEMRPDDHKSAAGLAKAARGMLTQRDAAVINSLATISVPTFISVGSKDAGYLTGTQYLSKKIAGAQYAVIDGAGHAANVDHPKAFNEALSEFLVTKLGPTSS